ncbi:MULTISPECIES: hypothetical protein [Rhodomicrobium]|uniref:hypothetical protein n=1 Tax=Rhodomicrobium TaxID=1068 RepID=UPI000F741888|nr:MULTISPECIES: hypothetical protein [Rhodomicrobium]
MATFFHCAPNKLDVGTAILPGNWGRIIRTAYPAATNNIPITYREALFEYARQLFAADKVSRLNCVFVLESFEAATKFRNTHQLANIIYEVEPSGLTEGNHRSDYDLTNWPQEGQCFDWVYDRARRYWLGVDIQNAEVLLPCPVKIISLPEGYRNPANSQGDA